ncbi:MAG: acetate--CoA ligase family protein, partial [Longimicrobiales bacterium]
SDGGGQGTLAIDLLDEGRVPRAELSDATRSHLRALLGPAAAVTNPVDLAGAADGDPGRFADALERLVADPAVGAVLVVGLFGGYGVRFDPALAPAETEAAERMAHLAAEAGRGLVVHTMYAPDETPPLAALRRAGIPVVESLEVACRCAAALVERGRILASIPWRPADVESPPDREEPVALSEPDARAVLEAAGLPLVPATFAADADTAVAAARACEGPVALKVVADGIVHKTDAGGVRLRLRTDAQVRDAFGAMAEAARARGATFRGVLVSPMAEAPTVELLLGGRRDAQVGPVVTVGAGGTWVEVLADVAHRLPPLDDHTIDEMLRELRIAPILAGTRGQAGVDLGALRSAIRAMAGLLLGRRDVVEAEINPLFAGPRGVVGVDARVYVVADDSSPG